MSWTTPQTPWFYSVFLVCFASLLLETSSVQAATETVTLKNGKTYEVKVHDDDGMPVAAKSRQVKMEILGVTALGSAASDSQQWVWLWIAKLRKKGNFTVTVTTPIDDTLSTSFETTGPGDITQQLFDSETYPTIWTWLDDAGTTWIPFVFSFEDTQSDNRFEITQWLRFDESEKIGFKLAATQMSQTSSGQSFTKTETVNPPFDDRDWELGNRSVHGEQAVLEYILSGETVEKWSELITVQSFTGTQGTTMPEDAMRGLKEGVLNDCPDAMWNLIRESEMEVLFEWRTEGCQGPVDSDDQYEIDRIIKGSSGLHRVAYTTKRQPFLPEAERHEWIERIGRAELILQVGVADNARRSYPVMPTRAVDIEGGSIAIQAGVMGDPIRPPLPFGKMKYPVRYFVNLFNETDRTIWYQIHWYFPHKSKDKLKQKSGPVQKLETGQGGRLWWAKYGVVPDKDHPLKIIISTDEEQKGILHTEETHMYFATADVDVFKERFDDFVSQGGGRLPLVSGWFEMTYPKTDIPGTVADGDLQSDIQYSLWKEQSKKQRDCEHETLRVESDDEEQSNVAVGLAVATVEGDMQAPGPRNVLREYWVIRSCEVTSKYEVLLAESSDGGAEIIVTKIGDTN